MDQLSALKSALKAFCRVVEAGGFSAAAAGIKVSHTAMSGQVRQLETLPGAQLLNRATRRLAPHGGRANLLRTRASHPGRPDDAEPDCLNRCGTPTTPEDLIRGNLVPVLPDYRMPSRDIYAVYPHNCHLLRRWHGHPIFSTITALGGEIECRSNWRICIEEFAMAFSQISGTEVRAGPFPAPHPITSFEKKTPISVISHGAGARFCGYECSCQLL